MSELFEQWANEQAEFFDDPTYQAQTDWLNDPVRGWDRRLELLQERINQLVSMYRAGEIGAYQAADTLKEDGEILKQWPIFLDECPLWIVEAIDHLTRDFEHD